MTPEEFSGLHVGDRVHTTPTSPHTEYELDGVVIMRHRTGEWWVRITNVEREPLTIDSSNYDRWMLLHHG